MFLLRQESGACLFCLARDGRSPVVELSWAPVQPPEKLLVRWSDPRAFLPLNVEDGRACPSCTNGTHVRRRHAFDFAAADPSAAFRVGPRNSILIFFDADPIPPRRSLDLSDVMICEQRFSIAYVAGSRPRTAALNLQSLCGGASAGMAATRHDRYRTTRGSSHGGIRKC